MEKVPEIQHVTAYIQTGISPVLVVDAVGLVPTTGWSLGRFVPRTVAGVVPRDGIYELDLLAIPPSRPSEAVISQIRVVTAYPSPPDDLEGVRIYGACNRMEALITSVYRIRDRIAPEIVAGAGEYPWP